VPGNNQPAANPGDGESWQETMMMTLIPILLAPVFPGYQANGFEETGFKESQEYEVQEAQQIDFSFIPDTPNVRSRSLLLSPLRTSRNRYPLHSTPERLNWTAAAATTLTSLSQGGGTAAATARGGGGTANATAQGGHAGASAAVPRGRGGRTSAARGAGRASTIATATSVVAQVRGAGTAPATAAP